MAMDKDRIREIFAEILPVRVRAMFGGHGIYDGDVMFALEVDGEIYLKADETTRGAFEQAGSKPFTYGKNGKLHSMNYWRLPESALDDGDELRRWSDLARSVARRPKAVKQRKPSTRAPLR